MKKLIPLLVLLMAGLTSNAQSVTFTLTTPPCNNNGVLQANVTGLTGTLTYHFYWYTGSINVTNNTGILTNYSGAPVQVTVTNGTGGGASGVYQGAPPFYYTKTITPGVCPALGSAAVTVTGGTPPYSYEWTILGTSTIVSTTSPASLPTGDYAIKITDAAGCVYGSEAGGDSISMYSTSGLTVNTTNTNAACTNGTATVTSVTGGVGPYSYLWSNGANTSGITGLVGGYYNVDVTSAQGCVQRSYVNVVQTPQISVNITPTTATCLQTNGSAIAFGSGGTPPYNYVWSNTQTGQTATNLTGGAYYSVTATDAAGCIGRSGVYVNTTTLVSATYTATASSCTSATGTATVTATGGATPYTITWNTFPAQSGATATGLSPGNYSFKVTDNNGCVRTGTAVVPPVSLVAANVSSANAVCAQTNGSAAVNVTSGTTPYTYLWSTGATTSSVSGLGAGSYSVRITDNAGCRVTKYVSIQAASPITTGLNVTQASCIYAADGGIVATPTGGTAPYTYNWSNNATTATLSGLASGNYSVLVRDAAGCVRSGNVFVPYNAAGTSCYCTITGTVYNDANSNCTKDAGETGIGNVMVHASGFGYTFTNAAGVYSFKVPSGTYTLSEQVQTTYPLAACQSNAQAVTVTAAAGCTNTINFANTVNPIHDVSINTISFNGPPVPGNNYYQRVVIANNGTTAETGIVGGYSHDNQLSAPTSIPAYFSANGGTNYRTNTSFAAVPAGSYRQFNIAYNVPTNIPLATTLDYKDTVAYITPITNWLTDYTPWNNVNAYTAVVVGSFDPNNKEVSPTGTGAQGNITTSDSTLTYTIHFQNTGTYPAQKVVLIDTLSSNLQLGSLLVGASSHNYQAAVTEAGVLKFTFDNINLPDSASNPLASIGYVMYTIKLKPRLALGSQIKNAAAIYFDYNAPVITNTTLNTITKNSVGVGALIKAGTLGMKVYPNPANDQVMIAVESGSDLGTANIRFVNLVGQVVLQQQVALHRGNNVFAATTTSLTPGLYFVEVSEGGSKTSAKVNIIR